MIDVSYVNNMSLKEAAHFWYEFCYSIIPIRPGTKIPALKRDAWLDDLNQDKIERYWDQHPDHEIACVIGKDHFVLDADTVESEEIIIDLMDKFDIPPSIITGTKNGIHFHLGRNSKTALKTANFDSTKVPLGIDVKAENSTIMLSPSTDKELVVLEADHVYEFAEADQGFVNAVFENNGQPAPDMVIQRQENSFTREGPRSNLQGLDLLLSQIDPDCGYDVWTQVCMGIFHETGGSDDGLDLVDGWSSQGSKYEGRSELEAKWRSFNTDVSSPITIATIYALARDEGEPFERCEFEVVDPTVAVDKNEGARRNPLADFSLRGQGEELAKKVSDLKSCLGNIAYVGQATVIYASPNAGKTLITLHLACQAIKDGAIDADDFYYIDVDDTLNGLNDKLKIAEEYGFHLIGENHNDFEADKMKDIFESIIKNGAASKSIVVLDTLKKFTDLMEKRNAAGFATVVRKFIGCGGTVIALAHVNKKKGVTGKSVYAGTSDIVDDFDCAYVIETIETPSGSSERSIEFENIKQRGNNAQTARFSYQVGPHETYRELLDSVHKVDESQAQNFNEDAQLENDLPLIDYVCNFIAVNEPNKTELKKTVKQHAGVSMSKAETFIERYTGGDETRHFWHYKRGQHNTYCYTLLDQTEHDTER